MTGERKAKILEGVVVSNKMDKTVTVEVERKFCHPLYKKVVIRSTKFYAHDESDAIEMGKRVRIQETRPLSKLKRWRVLEVLQ